MRFKSQVVGGYQVFAVTGINTVSFAIDSQTANTQGLLGFAVERHDPTENQRYFMQGFKVFPSIIPQPDDKTSVTTFEHPVQSFVWDDFTAKPDRPYSYFFYPLKGLPRNLDRSAAAIQLDVKTEPLFTTGAHDVFFNRGVASSQAYIRRFGDDPPDTLAEPKRTQALDWLSRDLDDALLKFIDNAAAGDTLLCCFYEFRYRPVADRLVAAVGRGVKVRLIIDAKINEYTDKDGDFHESFPRVKNLALIAVAGLNLGPDLIQREARKSDIQHNKFMVLLKGAAAQPAEVWTGSTNISLGGIHGQTNVGHWVRDAAVAGKYQQYWNLLSQDPGGRTGEPVTTVKQKNSAFRAAVEAIQAEPATVAAVAGGVTAVFSPRSAVTMLDRYAEMVDGAANLACITLAFGINKVFKNLLQDNNANSAVTFLLLEKEDKPNPRSTQPFVVINASNNVYKAWGSYIREPLHQWTRETSAGILGLNEHVIYIHSKFLLRDPLGLDPIVVSGSANFSDASIQDNDENMLLIRGHQRAADIYFTEFNRLFNHYYFRSVLDSLRSSGGAVPAGNQDSLFLREDDTWLQKYAPGTLRSKRVKMFTGMQGTQP